MNAHPIIWGGGNRQIFFWGMYYGIGEKMITKQISRGGAYGW